MFLRPAIRGQGTSILKVGFNSRLFQIPNTESRDINQEQSIRNIKYLFI